MKKKTIKISPEDYNELLAILRDISRYAKAVPVAAGNNDTMRLMGRFFWMSRTTDAALQLAERMTREK